MTDVRRRTDAVYRQLPPRDRAALYHGATKEGGHADPELLNRLPARQRDEFWAWVHVLQQTTAMATARTALLLERVDRVDAQMALWLTLRSGARDREVVQHYLRHGAAEPVTPEAYAPLAQAAACRMVTVREAGRHLALHTLGLPPCQDPDEAGMIHCGTAAAWKRHVDAAGAQIRVAVTDGRIVGRGRGRALRVQLGGVAAAFTMPLPVFGAAGAPFLVVADRDAAAVQAQQHALADLRAIAEDGPTGDWGEGTSSAGRGGWDALGWSLTRHLRAELEAAWMAVTAVEEVAASVREDVGADPLATEVREHLRALQDRLISGATVLAGPAAARLPEPDGAMVSALRARFGIDAALTAAQEAGKGARRPQPQRGPGPLPSRRPPLGG